MFMKRLRNRQLTIQRVVLIIFGVVMMGLAALGLLLSLGNATISSMWDPQTSVLNANADQFIADHTNAVRLAGMLGGITAVALSLYWLKLQLPPAHHQDDVSFVTTSQRADTGEQPAETLLGVSVVTGNALARAFEEDLAATKEIRQARAELRLAENTIRLRLDVDQRASLQELMSGPARNALERLSRVGEFTKIPVLVTDIKLVEGEWAKVA
jgi:hypothetical protein